MSKVLTYPRLPEGDEPRTMAATLTRLFVSHAAQINAAYEGRINAALSTTSTPATTLSSLTFAQGDFIRHSDPEETGVALSKYVLLGWICTTSGTAGGSAVFKELRCLTGN